MVNATSVVVRCDGRAIDGTRLLDAVRALAREGARHAVVESTYGATVLSIPFDPSVLPHEDEGLLLDELVETLMAQEVHHDGRSPDDVYTSGDCDVLAVALDEVLRGLGHDPDLHAIMDRHDDKGRIAKIPYLVHCGVRIMTVGGDGVLRSHVIDVRGRTPEDEWNMRWAENGACSDPDVDTVERADLERAQQEPIAPDRLCDAMPIAAILAAATLGPAPAAALRAA